MKEIQAIDVHAHYGDYVREAGKPLDRLMSGDAATVARRARSAGIALSVVSPLAAFMGRSGPDPVSANEQARVLVSRMEELYQWVVVDLLVPETREQARRMLRQPKCIGIKIHPEEHGYEIRLHGREVFELAAELGAVILTHSGERKSMPEDFAALADEYPG